MRYVYTLSDRGKDLAELLCALGKWGTKHVPGTMSNRWLERGAGASHHMLPTLRPGVLLIGVDEAG